MYLSPAKYLLTRLYSCEIKLKYETIDNILSPHASRQGDLNKIRDSKLLFDLKKLTFFIETVTKTEESKKRLQQSDCVKFLTAILGFTRSIEVSIYGMGGGGGQFKAR